jgi:hypothetical protein
MQITFTGADGKQITVADPRRPASAAKVTIPSTQGPASWILIQMKA